MDEGNGLAEVTALVWFLSFQFVFFSLTQTFCFFLLSLLSGWACVSGLCEWPWFVSSMASVWLSASLAINH